MVDPPAPLPGAEASPTAGTSERTDPASPELASPWRRLGAWTIDILLLAAPIVALEAAIFASCYGEGCLAGLAPFGLLLLLSPIYSITLIHSGGTIGMRAVGIRIQTDGDRPPGVGRSALRWLVGFIVPWYLGAILYALLAAAVPIPISIRGWAVSIAIVLAFVVVRLPLLLDGQRQGLHDKAARSVVVRSTR